MAWSVRSQFNRHPDPSGCAGTCVSRDRKNGKHTTRLPQMLPSGSQRRTIPIIQIVMNTSNLFVPSRKRDAILG